MKDKIIITGANGFIGNYLTNYFTNQGYELVGLVRNHIENTPSVHYVHWDGKSLGYWKRELEGAFAVINLAGKSVDCRYNQKNKNLIYNSRLDSTYIIGKAIEQCSVKPKYWLNAASATIYRHSEDTPMTESTGEIGSGFSVDVCKKWEELFFSFDHLETKLVGLRIAITLGDEGGVMIPFKRLVQFGFGGRMGSGKQMFSWINIRDLARSIHFILHHEEPKKVYNLSHPRPMTNKEFMQKLRKKYEMPFGFPNPEFVLNIGAVLIQTELELILKSRFVIPDHLIKEGFKFEVNDIA